MDRLPQLRAICTTATQRRLYVEEGDFTPPVYDGRADNSIPESAVGCPLPSTQNGSAVVLLDEVSEVDQETAQELATFFVECATVRSTLEEIELLAATLTGLHNENTQTVDPDRVAQLRQRMDSISNDIQRKAFALKEMLDSRAKKTAELRSAPDTARALTATLRIYDNQHRYAVVCLAEVMGAYRNQMYAAELAYRAQTERQIKIKYTNVDGSVIDDATAQLLTQQVIERNINSSIFQQSKDVLASIIETRNDIYRIEMSMRSLNQMFSDLAFLVNEQGELLDVILANVRVSESYLERGHRELKRARQYQRRSRKKMIILIVVVVVIILLFVLMGVLGKVIPK